MDLQSQVQDLLDLSGHVTLLLQKHSDTLIRKKTTVKNNNEEDLDMSYDIALASRSLQVLEVRREIRTVIGDLTEIKEKLENYGDNPSSNWFDYVQDTMECLHILLKKGIEIASAENQTLDQKFISYETPSSENIVYNRIHRRKSQQTLQLPRSDNTINETKNRISILVHKASEDSSEDSSEDFSEDFLGTIQDSHAKVRRHTMDSENVSATRLFVGNLGLEKSPSKASTTTSISSDQVCTNPARVPFWSTEATIEKIENDSSAVKHLSQLVIHENEELDDEFVDAVESQDSNNNDIHTQRELSSHTRNCMKRVSSVYSLPTTLNTEDDSYLHMSDYDDNFSESSFALSTLSTKPLQISLDRCSRPNNIFAENVTVNNPMRMGTGIGSYIVYTCTVYGPDGISIVARKRYSEFVKLRAQLVKSQPKYRKLIPSLPPKKIMGKFMPEFIEKRRKDMEYFLTYVLLHPVLGTTPVVKWWFID